ncbi:Hypothetical predicted protein [Paramuricea clavata]|uniref:Uncharacterized protein n=1 Tax=Paramuricea clavata TaxID=317549 RepID=A0A7D9HNZ1_PARCT|nr:Hypothetical predicted protein [Paramuricea clavata]
MKENADTAAKAKPHSLQVEDTVFVHQKHINKLSSPYNKHPYTIVKTKGSMITARNATSYITRNGSTRSSRKSPSPHISKIMQQTLFTMRTSTFLHWTILRKLGVILQEKIGDPAPRTSKH